MVSMRTHERERGGEGGGREGEGERGRWRERERETSSRLVPLSPCNNTITSVCVLCLCERDLLLLLLLSFCCCSRVDVVVDAAVVRGAFVTVEGGMSKSSCLLALIPLLGNHTHTHTHT